MYKVLNVLGIQDLLSFMTQYRYTLPSSRIIKQRYDCPRCGARRRFNRYIDTESNAFLHESVGRCDRENSCGYHYTPRQYFQDNGHVYAQLVRQSTGVGVEPEPEKPTSFVSKHIFNSSLQRNRVNYFIKWLERLFGEAIAGQLVNRYAIGTSGHWGGATVFWQIDANGNVRAGKIMLYNPVSGKRVKVPFNHINWVHNVLKLQDFNLQQCLFGEHLLKLEPTKPVAVVESEKTAIVASAYMPQFVWVAVGSLSNLTASRFKALAGRNVVLFPDLNGFEKWSQKVRDLPHASSIVVSDLLERKATDKERRQGWDIADYLIQYSFIDFKNYSLSRFYNDKKESEGRV